MKKSKNSKNTIQNISLESDFKWSVLFACIIFDILDTSADIISSLASSIGFGSGIISAIADTFNYFLLIAGFITFYILGKDNMSPLVFLPVFVDPIFEDALPSYSIFYIFTVVKGWTNGKK